MKGAARASRDRARAKQTNERTREPLDIFLGRLPGLTAATDLEELRKEWDR
jgi:hypothetical protein